MILLPIKIVTDVNTVRSSRLKNFPHSPQVCICQTSSICPLKLLDFYFSSEFLSAQKLKSLKESYFSKLLLKGERRINIIIFVGFFLSPK